MENGLLYILILAAIGIGWWLGRRERKKSTDLVGPNYYQGLNYLLNEEPDRAFTTFIDNLEVNNDTLETHLALGGCFWRVSDSACTNAVQGSAAEKSKGTAHCARNSSAIT